MSKSVDNMRAAHESWNSRDFDGVVRNVSDTLTYTDKALNHTFRSRNEFRKMVETWAAAFPDGKITTASYIDAGDTVIAQFTVEGTNTGTFAGLPPTGRRVKFEMCEICRCDKNGIALSGVNYYDQYSILTQLGHLKPLSAAA
jgi:steroid delta-isomerase-like uncharacterized protein